MNDIQAMPDDSEKHDSGLGYVRVELWKDGDIPSQDEPIESVLFPVSGGERYALEGKAVSFEEHFNAFIDHHLSGECDCLEERVR